MVMLGKEIEVGKGLEDDLRVIGYIGWFRDFKEIIGEVI